MWWTSLRRRASVLLVALSSRFELGLLHSNNQPPRNPFVNLAAMDDPENPYLVSHNFKHYTVISNTEFPIALEGTAQWFAVAFRLSRQTGLNPVGDAFP